MVCVGVVLTLSLTAQIAVWIRAATKTEMAEVEWHHQPITFPWWLAGFWGG